ncbi:MAG: hypothetical protein RMK89_09050 [Armatimonadota bacterium]|nr:hypothetical protein [Armatimonadota bacterium]MDW8143594.1 hypothetical protein [Armatimonadota bacterium]
MPNRRVGLLPDREIFGAAEVPSEETKSAKSEGRATARPKKFSALRQQRPPKKGTLSLDGSSEKGDGVG